MSKKDLKIKEITPFEKKVYAYVKMIPKGKVASYAWVAQKIGRPGSARAVGNALNKNPFAPQVPCHRVVCGDGRLGGFASGVQEKEFLLKKEGVKIEKRKVKKEFMLLAKKECANRKTGLKTF